MTDFADIEFLDDFLDETDRHVQCVTGHLLVLEAGERSDRLPAMLDEMLRSFHTLKGLCGMARLTHAADLSHAMESVLRAVKKEEIGISPSLVDALLNGVKMIETIIPALRSHRPPTFDAAPLIERLMEHLPVATVSPQPMLSSPARRQDQGNRTAWVRSLFADYVEVLPGELLQALSEPELREIEAAIVDGRRLALGHFTPTPEKASQGISITTVRDQLLSACRIVKAVPLMVGGAIQFAILVILDAPVDRNKFPALDWLDIPLPDQANAASPPHLGSRPVSASGADDATRGTSASSPALFRSVSSASVRVDIVRLDDLMRMVGDLVVSRSRLVETLSRLTGVAPAAVEALDLISANMERQLRELRGAVMRVRLVPLSEVFNRMPLAVRDMARETGKQVRLLFHGQETEIDKLLVDQLFDPLLHLVRNAVAHGIEPAAERRAAGKSTEGTLTIGGRPEGDHIVISVSDDGRGIEREKVLARARDLNLIDRESDPDAGDLLDILCMPGFTIKTAADRGAGRGVGMDVVSRAVKGLGGSLSMQTTPGRGTTFSLRLPLTLVIIDAFLVDVGNQRFAIPQGAVSEVVEVHESMLVPVESGEIFSCRGVPLPVARLATLFHLTPEPILPGVPRRFGIALITGEDGAMTALIVDRVLGTREVVVRPVTDPLVAQPGIAGATELGDGSVVLILDVAGLLRRGREKGGA